MHLVWVVMRAPILMYYTAILDFSVTNKFDFSYSNRMVQQVPEDISVPAEEEKILQFWSKFNCFRERLKQSKHRPKYVNLFGEGRIFRVVVL
jgi:hypothetical protein